MFLQNVVVSSFTLFYHFGRVNVGGILIILTVVAFYANVNRDGVTLYAA